MNGAEAYPLLRNPRLPHRQTSGPTVVMCAGPFWSALGRRSKAQPERRRGYPGSCRWLVKGGFRWARTSKAGMCGVLNDPENGGVPRHAPELYGWARSPRLGRSRCQWLPRHRSRNGRNPGRHERTKPECSTKHGTSKNLPVSQRGVWTPVPSPARGQASRGDEPVPSVSHSRGGGNRAQPLQIFGAVQRDQLAARALRTAAAARIGTGAACLTRCCLGRNCRCWR